MATSPLTLPPIADAFVDSANPARNYGALTTLRVDASAPVQRSFLRFDLSGVTGTVTSATLRVWAETGQVTGYDVYGVANTTWIESGTQGITWNNAPALGGLIGSSGKATANTWASVDVTPFVSTGHSVSFALTTTNSTALRMSSKETTTGNAPQLVVQTATSSDTQPPTTPTNVTATPSSPTQIDLAWSASSDDVGVTGYGIYKDGSNTPMTVSGSTLNYSDTSVTGGSTHSYTVDAFDAAGNHSAKSAPVQATTPDAPGCKTNIGPSGAYSVTVCLTLPTAGTVSGSVQASATASVTSLNGQTPPIARVRFCVDDTGCDNGATGYALSDFKANQNVYSALLPTAGWVDGVHTVTARPWMGDGSPLGQPTPAVNLTFSNGVTTPPGNGGTFTPTSGTTPGQGQPLVVAAVGDGASGETNSAAVASQIAGWNPNLVLYLGDVYEKGSPSEFFNYYGATSFGQFKSITDPTVGNHEYGFDNQASGYFNYWDSNKHYYSFDAGGWHFISLDANTSYGHQAPGSDQYQWLQGDLAADTAPCTLAYWHQPLYNVGAEGPAGQMQAIWSLLVSHGGMLVVNGHDHDYQRYAPLDWTGQANPNGVTEIITGSGGHGIQQPLGPAPGPQPVMTDFNNGDFGALKLTLHATSADVDFTTTSGKPVDHTTVPCNPPPTPPPPVPSLTLTPLDANDFVTNSTVFYNPNSASGSFTVGATATGATSMQFPPVFGTDGATDTTAPFSQTYTWTSGVSTSGSFAVTASNTSGPSPPGQFTVTPDATAPSTSALCNFGSCAGPFSSTVSVNLASSDDSGGSGVAATYYTTDGSDPTTSNTRTLYAGPFLVSTTTTVRYSALDKVGNVETPQSVTVTVNSSGIALIQKGQNSGNVSTLAVTLPAASVSGDTLVAVVAVAAGSSASVHDVTDSSGTAWTAAPVVGFLTGTNSRVEIWYRLGAPSVTSVTVTLSAAKAAAMNVSEWSGVAAFDNSAHAGTASSTTASTPSLPTNNATDLVIGAINYPAAATATLTSGPFTGLPPFGYSTTVHGNAAYQLTSGIGSYQATWTLSVASGGSGGAILALKAA